MTHDQKNKLDSKLHEFSSFIDFHKYAFENDILFDMEEWEEYSGKMKKMLHHNRSFVVEVDFENLIVTV